MTTLVPFASQKPEYNGRKSKYIYDI